MADLILDWREFGDDRSEVADGTTVDTGGINVTVGFTAEGDSATALTFEGNEYVAPDESFNPNSALKVAGHGSDDAVGNGSTTTLSFASSDSEFGDEVQDVSFRINDVDTGTDGNSHVDIVSVRAYDAAGNAVPVALSNDGTVDISGNTATADDPFDSEWYQTSQEGSVLVNIPGPVSRIEVDFNNGDTEDQYIWMTDVHFSTLPAEAARGDGIVTGSDDDDVIDTGYTGDPEGDRIDNDDSSLPGTEPNDDVVRAGDGDDTVEAGEGSDAVQGGEGDDLIDTGNGRARPDHPSFQGVAVDPMPDDDRDNVEGGAGDDIITTGDDADTIYGGTGHDSIDAGIDDDAVFGGDGNDWINGGLGNDSIDGGAGNDTIISGQDAFSDYVGDDPNLPVDGLNNPDGSPAERDPNPEDDRDTVYGGGGNDYIATGDDADIIHGGAGRDTIDGGIDDDYIEGNAGHDYITGGHGSDTIYGGQGDDWINAGDSDLLWGQEPDDTDPVPENGRDFVDGGAGNDTILGQDDDDTLHGGTGDDVIDGGIDDDSITGGSGNDTLTGGQGTDQLSGGDDRDVFYGITPGDVIDGGEGGDDFDTLDLSGSISDGGSFSVTYDVDNPENGGVEYFDPSGASIGAAQFFKAPCLYVETYPACFR